MTLRHAAAARKTTSASSTAGWSAISGVDMYKPSKTLGTNSEKLMASFHGRRKEQKATTTIVGKIMATTRDASPPKTMMRTKDRHQATADCMAPMRSARSGRYGTTSSNHP
ncbi:hypothetical protein D3C73_1167690 [compost metagenome]